MGCVQRSVDRVSRLAAVAVAMVAALGLSGCGRKGPLDPPPSSLTNPQPMTQRPSLGDESGNIGPSLTAGQASSRAVEAAPASTTASPPPKKTFPLDFLIGK
jgi:predicted small lipoprotein YifL